MSKSHLELMEKAKKLMEKAKKIEEQQAIKIGKEVLKLYKNQNIKDENLLNIINKILK